MGSHTRRSSRAPAIAQEYLDFETLLARYLRRPPRTILFSPMPDWEPAIRRGFSPTPHAISFAEPTAATIAEHELIVPLTLSAIGRLRQLAADPELGPRIRKGPDSPLSVGVSGCPYLELFTAMLRCLDFEGICCVNYKVSQGRAMLLEINPRFGASLAIFFFSFVRHLFSRDVERWHR